jgi:hypothetical protein
MSVILYVVMKARCRERHQNSIEVKISFFCLKKYGVFMIDLSRKVCKPVLKPDFTSHDIMESLRILTLGTASVRTIILCIPNLKTLT